MSTFDEKTGLSLLDLWQRAREVLPSAIGLASRGGEIDEQHRWSTAHELALGEGGAAYVRREDFRAGDDAEQREHRLGLEGGKVAVSEKTTAGDRERASALGYDLGTGGLDASWSAVDGGVRRSVASGYSEKEGVRFGAAHERATAVGDDQWSIGHALSYAAGKLGLERAEDFRAGGVKETRRHGLSLAGGHAAVSAETAREEDGKQATSSASLALDKGALTGGVVRHDEATDGTTTTTRDRALRLGEGNDFSARIAGSRRIAIEEQGGQEMAEDTALDVGWKPGSGGRILLERGESGKIAGDDGAGEVVTTGRRAKLGWQDGFLARVTDERQVADAALGTERTARRDLAYDGKQGVVASIGSVETAKTATEEFRTEQKLGLAGGALTASHSRRHVQEGGAVSETSTAGKLGWDGVSVQQKRDGTSFGGSLDWDKGQLGGQVAHTVKSADGKEGLTLGGSAAIDGDGGWKAAGSIGRGGTSVSLSAGVTVEAEVVPEGEGFAVVWRRKASAGAGGGAAGVTASVSHGETDHGRRRFASEAEAKAFADDAAARIPRKGPDPSTVAGALALEIGESRGVSQTTGASVGGTVSGIGIGVEGSTGGGQTVERLDVSRVLVTVEDEQAVGGNLTASVASASARDTTKQRRTVLFDLATPEGQADFARFQATGVGGEVVGESTAAAHEEGTGLSLGSLFASTAEQRTWEERTVADGHEVERYGGENERGLRSKLLGGHTSRSVSLVGTEADDRERSYRLSARVGASDAKLANQDLARIAGVSPAARNDGEHLAVGADGKATPREYAYHLDAAITEEDVARFQASAAAGRASFGALGTKGDLRHELRDDLLGAGSTDDQMRALASFVAEGGPKAIAVLRDTLGEDAVPFDLRIDGDATFPGLEGRLALEAKIDRYTQVIAASPAGAGTLLDPIDADLGALLARRKQLAKYPWIPAELLAREAAKLDGQVAALTELRRQAARAGSAPVEGEAGEGELHELREEIAHLDDLIDAGSAETRSLRAEAVEASYRPAPGPAAAYRRAQGRFRRAEAMVAEAHQGTEALDGKRIAFVRALAADPERPGTIAAGHALAAELRQIEQGLGRAANAYLDVIETYRDPGDDGVSMSLGK